MAEATLCKQTELKTMVLKKIHLLEKKVGRVGEIALTFLLSQFRRTPLIWILTLNTKQLKKLSHNQPFTY
jgi:hypothetical protein